LRKKRWAIALLVFILSVSLALPQNVLGMDNYTHDANISRDNTVVDSSFNGLVYNNNPYYMEIPQWNGYQQYSNTTPVVVGNQLWQYTYDDSGYGHLWELNLQKPGSDWVPGNAVSVSVSLIQDFDVGTSGANGEVNSAAGVSGPTISQGYLAIAVGNYLYWWPVGHPDQEQSSPIGGNPGNTIQLIAASPLITPPLTASGMDMTTGDTVTWQTPFAVVGSWSGGVVSKPLYTPANVPAISYNYQTTDDASNATNDIVTSSPAWNSHTTALGTQGAAVFGVDAAQSGMNRLILMDPASGNYQTVYEANNSPIFYGPIDSSPAVVSDGTMFVPDQGAGIYKLSANGDYMADDTTAMDQSNPCIANVAVDGENVIWVGNGHTTLNAASISAFGQGSSAIGSFNGLDTPAVVNNGSTDTVFLASTGTAGLLVTNPLNWNDLPVSFQQDKYTWQNTWQTLGSVSPAYTSVAADVGTDSTDGSALHYLATWTDYGYDSQGCIEIWAPSDYGVTAIADPSPVNSGEQVIITAHPTPEGVTQSMKAHITDGGKNTLDIDLGQWSSSPEKWLGVINAPNNYTGANDNYTVTVTATEKSGKTATATAQFIVNPIPLPPPGNLTGTLKIDAWRRNNTTQPAGTAKYGDDLAVTLTVDTPPLPSGLLNAQITNAYITKAWIHTPQGHPGTADSTDSTLIIRSEKNIDLTLNGLTASTKYKENWAGYPPPIPDNSVMETNHIFAPFSVHVDYMYQVPVATKDGVTYIWETGSYDASGNASTDLNITGTELYIFNQPQHDPGTPAWEP